MKIPIIQPLIIHLKGSVEFSQGLEGDTQEHEVDFHLWVTKMICQAMDFATLFYIIMAFKICL